MNIAAILLLPGLLLITSNEALTTEKPKAQLYETVSGSFCE